MQRPAGTTTVSESNLLTAPLLLGLAALLVALGITEYRRMRVRRLLAVSKTCNSIAAEAGHLGFWTFDSSTKQMYLSPEARTLLGLDAQAPIDLNAFLGCVHPDDVVTTREAIDRAAQGGGSADLELRVVHGGNHLRWVKAGVRPRDGAGGRVREIDGVLVDITEHKQNHLQVEQQKQHITHMARVSILGELSGGLAHELNQPLSAILSNAQAAQRMLSRQPLDVSELRETVRDIIEDDTRARELIRHMRSLLKGGEVRRDNVDINQTVLQTIDLAHSDLIKQDVAVITHLDPHLPPVYADRIQLQQVVLNLVLNGIDAMEGVEAGARTLVISTFLDTQGLQETAHISIEDNGSGIRTDTLGQVFEPFYSTKSHGLGLGLSISRSIMSAHDGHLWAANNPERGATFHVVLPIAQRAVA